MRTNVLTRWLPGVVAGLVLLAATGPARAASPGRGARPSTAAFRFRLRTTTRFRSTFHERSSTVFRSRWSSRSRLRRGFLLAYGFRGMLGFPSYGPVSPVLAASPGGSGGGSFDPYAGSLADGQEPDDYRVNEQRAKLLREQGRQAQLATRWQAFDEYLYERRHTPTHEELRQEQERQFRDRSRNNPPVTEIFSSRALNDLLVDLQRLPRRAGGAMPLDPEVTRRLNFTTGRGSGSVALLKDVDRLPWPAAFAGPDYRPVRVNLSALAREAVADAAGTGRVDAALLEEMERYLARLEQTLRQNVTRLAPTHYTEAGRFVTQFAEAVQALRQPDAGSFFNDRYRFQGDTVAELVRFMTERGLRFAPAVPGDEAGYLAVHRALAAYDQAASPVLEAERARKHGDPE